MELVVLGTSGAYPEAGHNCSGYLVSHDGTDILCDLGSGVLSELQRHRRLSELDAVVISHLHADHFLDLYPLQVFERFESERAAPLPVYCPPGADERILRLDPSSAAAFRECFDFRYLDEEAPFQVAAEAGGGIKVFCVPTRHAEEAYALRFAAAYVESGSRAITYTADTGPSADVTGLASESGLLIAECSWLDRPENGAVGHLTASECGEMAQAAGVQTLLLSHFWPGMDREDAAGRARSSFSGTVLVANEGLTVRV